MSAPPNPDTGSCPGAAGDVVSLDERWVAADPLPGTKAEDVAHLGY